MGQRVYPSEDLYCYNAVQGAEPEAYRRFWLKEWSSRIAEPPEIASGRSLYEETRTAALVADAASGLDLQPTDWLLDVGCAKELMAPGLTALVARYVGIDYVKGFRPEIIADAVALPFVDGCFDKVLLSGVLLVIHPQYHAAVLGEMRRVTRDGGRAFISGNPFTFVHSMAFMFAPEGMVKMIKGYGWSDAWITPINPMLEQHQQYFDLVAVA